MIYFANDYMSLLFSDLMKHYFINLYIEIQKFLWTNVNSHTCLIFQMSCLLLLILCYVFSFRLILCTSFSMPWVFLYQVHCTNGLMMVTLKVWSETKQSLISGMIWNGPTTLEFLLLWFARFSCYWHLWAISFSSMITSTASSTITKINTTCFQSLVSILQVSFSFLN